MKDSGFLFTLFLFLAGCQGPAAVESSRGKGSPLPVIRSARAPDSIRIDGRLDDWKEIQGVRLKSADGKQEALAFTEVKVLHDDRYLYIAFHCEDPDIWTDHRGRDSHMWTEDVVEVFIDLNPADPEYVELEVNPLGDLFDGIFFEHRTQVLMAWNPEIKVSVQAGGTVNKRDDTDRSWTVEMAIPVGDLTPSEGVGKPGARIEAGAEWRINFYRNERSGKTGELQAWAPVRGDFHAPALFGRVVFE